MNKVFKVGQKFHCPSILKDIYRITVVDRTENTISFTCDTENNSDKHIYTQRIILLNESLSEGFNVIPSYMTEAFLIWDKDGKEFYVYATDFEEAEMKMRRDKVASWKERGIVDSQEDMLKLINILDAHKEDLKSLQEFVAYQDDAFCGFIWVDLPDTEREVAELLFEHNRFYRKWEDLLTACIEACMGTEMNFEEYMSGEDIRKTPDGYVRVLHY